MLTYPVAVDSLEAFEESNKIHLFVYGWNEGEGVATRVYPRTARKAKEGWREVVLMLNRKHYSWVKNFQRLMALPADRHGRHYCHRCVSSYRTNDIGTGEENLRKHLEQGKCTSDEPDDAGPPMLPEVKGFTKANGERVVINPSISFRAYELLHDHPLVIYADFETYQSKSPEQGIVSRMTGVASYAYKIVSKVPTIESSLVVKLGTADDFLEEIQKIAERYQRAIEDVVPLKGWVPKRGRNIVCYACGGKPPRGQSFVKDHDHFTGEFRGYACEKCT